MNKAIIEFKDIEKHFGSVIANKNINFKLFKNKIYALLGENGAGKSTLMNILSGIYKADKGEIFHNGEKVIFKSPKDAIESGIGMIYQHFKLIENKTSLENLILGKNKDFFLKKNKIKKQVEEICKKYSIKIDLSKKVEDMSISEKQTLEILKVLYRGAELLILDEPTAVLTPQETKHLFTILKDMKNKGCTIIIITHKLHEIMDISDEVIIMRKGEVVKDVLTSSTSEKELTDLMVGETVDLKIDRASAIKGKKILQIKDLEVSNHEKIKKIKNISFDIYEGEILGVAGLAGSGQKELCESIAGIQKVDSGNIIYEEECILGKSPREISEHGISMSFIPEDRLGMGLVSSMSMVDNMILKDYYKQKGFILKRKEAREKSIKLIDQLKIKTPGEFHPVKELSGGNIQKVLLGRELNIKPHLLITAYPTRGLDISSSHLIYDIINEQKQNSVGIMYIGEDLDVLLELSDRIMVLCDGVITGIVDSTKTSKEELGFLMAGKTLKDLRTSNQDSTKEGEKHV